MRVLSFFRTRACSPCVPVSQIYRNRGHLGHKPRRCPGRVLNRCWTRRATGADSGAVNANSSVANSAGSSADSSRATQPVKEEARVEEPRRRGGEVTSRRDKETGGDGAARQRGSRKGGGHTTTLCIYGTHIVYGKSGAESLGGTSTRCQSMTFYINGSGTWTSNFRIIV